MHLALHAASPKLEAFYQYYADYQEARFKDAGLEDCGSWVDWYGQVVCDVETLVHLYETHLLGSSEAENACVLVLFLE